MDNARSHDRNLAAKYHASGHGIREMSRGQKVDAVILACPPRHWSACEIIQARINLPSASRMSADRVLYVIGLHMAHGNDGPANDLNGALLKGRLKSRADHLGEKQASVNIRGVLE